MRFLLPKLKVVVAVASPIAFEALNGANLLTTSLQTAKEFAVQSGLQSTIAIAAPEEYLNNIAFTAT